MKRLHAHQKSPAHKHSRGDGDGEDVPLGERLADPLLDRPPSLVSDRLFCGADWNLASGERLRALGVGAVLCVADEPPEAQLTAPFAFMHVTVGDDPSDDIRQHFERTTAFIDAERAKQHAVLVVSPRGLSRAPTVCIAYLMYTRPMQLRDAYHAVRAARPTARPNVGFFMQLMDYEMQLRHTHEPSMTLQEYRRGLLSLWGPERAGDAPMSAPALAMMARLAEHSRRSADGDDYSDSDSSLDSANDIDVDALDDPADIPRPESDFEDSEHDDAN